MELFMVALAIAVGWHIRAAFEASQRHDAVTLQEVREYLKGRNER